MAEPKPRPSARAEKPQSSSINAADFFNKDEYSDLTIKYAGQEFKAHKIILCTKSEYFKKLCGPGTPFAEGNQKIIELKDDDPDAVTAMLEWIYTFTYLKTYCTTKDPAMLLIELIKVADKYLLPALLTSASGQLRKHVARAEVVSLTNVCAALEGGEYPSTAQDVVHECCLSRMKELLECEDFRRLLLENPTLSLELHDRRQDSEESQPEGFQSQSAAATSSERPRKLRLLKRASPIVGTPTPAGFARSASIRQAVNGAPVQAPRLSYLAFAPI